MVMQNFLSRELIREKVPSVFAQGRDTKTTSDRYVFMSTERILDAMEENEWGVVKAESPCSRFPQNESTGVHKLTFRPRNEDFIFEDPRIKVINHGSFHLENAIVSPEINLINAHNGSKSLQFSAGLHALICENGLTISVGDFGSFAQKHKDFDPEDAFRLISEFHCNMDNYIGRVAKMHEFDLLDEQKLEFATGARNLRFGVASNVDPNNLLTPTRISDSGSDLWTVFNVVQEHSMKGGFIANKRKARKLTNIKRCSEFNQGLINLAVSFMDK